MRIIPDYTKKTMCYFCGQNLANEKSSTIETLNAITKAHKMPISVDYISVDVEVPRCRRCEKKHSLSTLPTLSLFILFSLCFGWWLLTKGEGWTDTWYMTVFGIIITFLLSSLAAVFVGAPIRLLINQFFQKGCKDLDDTDNYTPIKKLRSCGFSTKRPDGLGSQTDEILDKVKFSNTLSSIVSQDNCRVIK